MPLIRADPPLVNLVNGYRIQVMQLFPPVPHHDDQVCRFQQTQVLGDCLSRHVEASAQSGQRLPVGLVQLIE